MTEQRSQNVQLPLLKYFILNFFGFTIPLYPSFFLCVFYYRIPQLFGVWTWIFFPLVLTGAILLWIFLVIEFSALITRCWRKKSPPVEGVFHRTFSKGNVEDDRLKYYHDRGYIIKFPVWLASKSPFPWLLKYVLIRIGYENNIGRDVTFMDTIPGLEFTTIMDGVIYYPGSSTASHVVDSIFGNLTIKRLTIEKNAAIFPHTIIGPGVQLNENNALLPRSAGIKDWKSKSDKKFYSGSPGRPINDYEGVFSVLPKKLYTRFQKQGFLLGSDIDRYSKEN
jgi:acetyltransferase-like isoleucine patch superfamily enzyme